MLHHMHVHPWSDLACQRLPPRTSNNLLHREIGLAGSFAMEQGGSDPDLISDLDVRFCCNDHFYIVTMFQCKINKFTKRKESTAAF